MKDNNGDYPVTIALEWGQADILETILAVPPAQLDLGVTDLYGDNVAQIAVESSEVSVLHSHWSRSNEARLSLVESCRVMLAPAILCHKERVLHGIRLLA